MEQTRSLVALVTRGAKIKQGENCCIVDNQPLRKSEGKTVTRRKGRDLEDFRTRVGKN